MDRFEKKAFIGYASFVTKVGIQHIREGKDSDDIVVIIEKSNFCFYGLADGQSGKKHSKTGGREVLNAIAEYLEEKGINQLNKYQHMDEIQYEITRVIRNVLNKLSKQYQENISEFSSTIVVYAFNPVTCEDLVVHLGDGAIIGITSSNKIEMISSPENGITNQYTWLTSSSNSMTHIRISKGYIRKYHRVVLVTDGTTSICHGKNISFKSNEILGINNSKKDVIAYVDNNVYRDDASCIVIDY